MRSFILIFAFCCITPAICFAQSNPISNPVLVHGSPIALKLAAPNTFQLVVPSSKYLDLYDEIITDSILFVITKERQATTDAILTLTKGMKIVVLSQEKVNNGFRIPKTEVEK